jgi:hypothetical protein
MKPAIKPDVQPAKEHTNAFYLYRFNILPIYGLTRSKRGICIPVKKTSDISVGGYPV